VSTYVERYTGRGLSKAGNPKRRNNITNFYTEFYQEHREILVKYGIRFDRNSDTAEDLFEVSHAILCDEYPNRDGISYVKLMKTLMANQYRDKLRREGYLDKPELPESFFPKAFPPLDEVVCKREEIHLLAMAISQMSVGDQEILTREGSGGEIKSWRKYQAIKRLEKKVIEVIVSRRDANQANTEEAETKKGEIE
jgi:hypothetical protein